MKYYTQSGELSPPIFFYLSLIFLARTWVLFVISLVLHDNGSPVLALIYPQKDAFYLGLISGVIALLLFILSGRVHHDNSLAVILWRRSYPFLMLSISSDFILQLYSLSQNNFQYSLIASVQLVLIIWIFLYSLRSSHLKMSFFR